MQKRTREIYESERFSVLDRISHDGVGIVVHRRFVEPLSVRLSACLTRFRSFGTLELSESGLPPERLSWITDDELRAWVAADVSMLARKLRAATGARAVSASLEHVRSDACRKFHADGVGIRLLCTYVGPGTEWIPSQHVDRRFLCRGDLSAEDANRLIAPDYAVRKVRAGDVIMLKGDGWPGHAGRGAVHRSPQIEASGAERLVLKLDLAN